MPCFSSFVEDCIDSNTNNSVTMFLPLFQLDIRLGVREDSDSDIILTNVTVSPDVTETLVLVSGMSPGRTYPVHVSAVNPAGVGPSASAPLTVAANAAGAVSAVDEDDKAGYAWLIALLGSAAFVLVFVSGVLLYYRRIRANSGREKYLAANTADSSPTAAMEYHGHHYHENDKGQVNSCSTDSLENLSM